MHCYMQHVRSDTSLLNMVDVDLLLRGTLAGELADKSRCVAPQEHACLAGWGDCVHNGTGFTAEQLPYDAAVGVGLPGVQASL